MIEQLEQLIKDTDSLAGSWSGEETTFLHEGSIRQEEEAHMAVEISNKAKELKELISEFEEL